MNASIVSHGIVSCSTSSSKEDIAEEIDIRRLHRASLSYYDTSSFIYFLHRLDHQLSLPRNTFRDIQDDERYHSAANALLEKHHMVLRDEHLQSQGLYRNLADDTPSDVKDAAIEDYLRISWEILKARDEHEELLHARNDDCVEERYLKDPRTGTCDAICTVKTPKFFDSVYAAKKSGLPLFIRDTPISNEDPGGKRKQVSKLDKNVSNVLKAGQFTKHHSSPIDKAAKKFKHL